MKSNKNNPIGVFDSGVGGLTVLKELLKLLPNEDYIYIADNKNSPYGDKSKQELKEYIKKILNFFEKQDVKLVIVACNTASSYIEEISKNYNLNILNIIDAAINKIDNKYKNILLTATKATIEAEVYDKKIFKKLEKIKYFKEACPKIVPSIENEDLTEIEKNNIIKEYLGKYYDKKIDLLILGCTHYPIWKENFKKNIGINTKILDPSKEMANMTREYLVFNNLNSDANKSLRIYITKNTENFKKNAEKILEKNLNENIEKIDL